MYTAARVLVKIASTKEALPNRVVAHVPKREKSRKEVVCRSHLEKLQ